jgi:hypothetical protein
MTNAQYPGVICACGASIGGQDNMAGGGNRQAEQKECGEIFHGLSF